MKAAIYNPYWSTLGGGERYTASFVKFLEETGYEVTIWSPENLRSKINDRFGVLLTSSKFEDYDPLKSSLVDRLLRTSQYDLIFWVSDGSIPISFAKKTIIHMQIPAHWKGCGTWSNRTKIRNYTVICNSKFTKNIIDKIYKINSQVIYPPIDVKSFRSLPKQNLIVSIGRLGSLLHAKRQDVLIQAFEKLSLNLKSWRLVLAGGSDDESYILDLKRLIRDLPIEIIQNPPLKQIHDLLSQAKFFWSATGYEVDISHPEFMEHFGITTVEAMAAGCVPLVTNCGGHLETIIDGKTGYLWSTVDELVNKTLELVQDKKKLDAFSKEAVERSSIFSKERFYRDVATILQASFPSGK